MVCHGELYRLRPDPRHLTGYYLMIAAGGALGGLFVAVIAPLIFTDYFELHWGLLLCGLLFLVVCLRNPPLPARGAAPSPAHLQPTWRREAGCAGASLWAVGLVALGVALWVQAHRSGESGRFTGRGTSTAC